MKKKIINTFLLMSFLLSFAPGFFFTTYPLFLAERNMSVFQMSLINASFMLSVFILEIPTGAFADSFGRRHSIIAGCLAWGFSFYTYFFCSRLSGFILAEIIGAFGCTLISGALEAWLIDSLHWQKIKLPLEEIFRREEMAKQAGIISGSFLGAIIGARDLALPWLLSGTGMIIAGLAAAVLMKEPYFQKKSLIFSFQPLISTAKESWRTGRRSPAFLRVILISTALALSVQALNMQWSLLFRQGFKLPIWALGLVYTGISLFTVLGARLAPFLAKKSRHEGQGLALAFAFIGLMMLLSGQAGIFLPALLFFLFHEFGRGLFSPLKKAIVNRRIEGRNRATMLSLESMMTHAGAFIGLLGGGWLGNTFSISTAWAGSGLILLIIAPFLWKKGV